MQRDSRVKDVVFIAVIAVVVFAAMYVLLGFAKNGLDAPLKYGGDELLLVGEIKSVHDSGWLWHDENLGAPFGSDLVDYSLYQMMNFEMLMAKFISIFVDDPVVILTILYLLIFPLCVVIAFAVLRCLKIRRLAAGFGAVLFACAPYIQARQIAHFQVAVCYFVPLSVLLCAWAFDQKDDRYLKFQKGFFRYKKNIAAIVFALLIANNGGGYYPIFSCYLLCAVAFCGLFADKKAATIRKSAISAAMIAGFFFLALAPHLIYQMKNGQNLIVRSVASLENYGLKPIQMFIPLNSHGIGFIDRLIRLYNENMPLVNENRMVYLGVGAGVGFLISMLALLTRKWSFTESDGDAVYLVSRLNLFSIALGMVGGFASVAALIGFRFIRSYNRISIYILFLSVWMLCLTLQTVYDRIKGRGAARRYIWTAGCILFAAVCLYDTLPTYGANDQALAKNKELYYVEREFVDKIEDTLEDGDMVFQLPYHVFPEGGRINSMPEYKQFTGYIHSETLKWSYGGVNGRISDKWNKYVSRLPVPEMIDTIAAAGFKGIYIDTRAYTSGSMDRLKKQIESRLNAEPVSSSDGMLLFYNLYPYIEENPDVITSPSYLDEDFSDRLIASSTDLSYKGDHTYSEADDAMIMSPGASQYGPYMSLAAGVYQAEITVKGLEDGSFDVAYKRGAVVVPVNEKYRDDSKVIYEFEITEDVSDIELRMTNRSKNDIELSSIRVERIEEP